MIGLLINDREEQELEYLLKREMEELLHVLEDSKIDDLIKNVMEERYQTIFRLFSRFASKEECSKYVRSRRNRRTTGY